MPDKLLKVLLVEDSDSDARLLKENILLSGGKDISVSVAKSLSEAKDHLKNNHTDAVLLDLTLPDSSGLDTVRQAKHISLDLPIVVLTGVDDEKTGIEAVRMGVQDYLVKGQTDGRTITRVVHYSIERKRMEAELRKARDEMEDRVKERTAELRESEERYRQLVEVSPDGIGVEINDKIVFINTAGAKLLGCKSPEELIGRPVIDFVHPDNRKRSLKLLQDLRRNRGALPLREARVMRVDGTFLDVEVAVTSLIYQNKPATQIVFHDITERKLAEERSLADQKQLRSLTAELVLVEERERHEIATALHDSIGPILAFSKRELGTLQKSVPREIADSLKNIGVNISQAVDLTRTLTFDLSPPTLYTLGFETAIEELTERFCEEHKLGYSFSNGDEPKPLTDHVKILLYRSVRELLINIAKHAKARMVKVVVSRARNDIRVTVEDNGRGFDASAFDTGSHRPRGFGLFSVRERLTHIGGKLEIESVRGKGTKVTLLAPLKPGENRKKED